MIYKAKNIGIAAISRGFSTKYIENYRSPIGKFIFAAFLNTIILFSFFSCTNYPSVPNCLMDKDSKQFHVFYDFDEAFACSTKSDFPILIVFDSWGGSSTNTWKILELNDVWNLINNQFVVLVLMVDERIPLEQPYTICLREKDRLVKTIGQQHLYFQRTYFNTNTQPFYAIVDHKLNQLAIPRGYTPIKDKKKFIDFLKQGLK